MNIRSQAVWLFVGIFAWATLPAVAHAQNASTIRPNTDQNAARPGAAQTNTSAPQQSGRQQTIQAPVINPPEWANQPVSAEMEDYLNKLLSYWESSSLDIQLYRCSFTRWEYNPLQCNWRNAKNHLAAHTISRGVIRYSAPDKGMYEVNEKWGFDGPNPEDAEQPKYKLIPKDEEKWICDGRYIYEFDFENKRLYDMELPPDAQGEGLRNSPLPFVFGAKADDLKQRFWIRDITPPNAANEGQYWLEAWPKRIDDAQTYQKVEIILTRNPFLPRSLVIYPINYHPLENPSKMVFEFTDLEINGALMKVQNFLKWFIKPAKPLGWERVEAKLYGQPELDQMPRVGQTPETNR